MGNIKNKKLAKFLDEHTKKSDKFYENIPKLTEKELEFATEQMKEKDSVVTKILNTPEKRKRVERMLEEAFQ